MPELPEIAVHAERLAVEFEAAELSRFVPIHLTALKTFDPQPTAVVGRRLSGTGHRGKYLYLHFDGDYTFVVHLMQGGRLRPDAKRSKKPRGGMARWEFGADQALLLTEAGTEHRAGVWLVAGDPEGGDPVGHLGPDADTMSRDDLAQLLGASRERVHGFLRDQTHVAGIGRLLANEILHAARLSPFATTNKLDEEQIDRLHASLVSTMKRAFEFERTQPEMGRSADRPSDVHHRVGEACVTCGDEVRAVEYRRYTVAYCPTCQTGGKVLADNTTSKFLK